LTHFELGAALQRGAQFDCAVNQFAHSLRVTYLKDSSEGFQRGKHIMQALTGKLTSFVARVFGCWHADLSRPFSREGRAYRTCLSCGAQRRFNLRNWEMHGKFYYSN